MNQRSLGPLASWLKQPASWVSLSAALVSITTFFLVYAHRGELKVFLPDRIGVSAQENSLSVIVPLTLTNTGAPRTRRHITKMLATIRPLSTRGTELDEIPLRWEYEVQFVSSREYRKRYPDFRSLGGEDVVTYVNRAFPFQLGGESSVGKVFRFEQQEGTNRHTNLSDFEIAIRVETESENLLFAGKYRGPGKLERVYVWCEQID